MRLYGRELSTLEIYQNYNATKSKYFNEAPYIASKISTSAIVYDTQLGLNYDFASTGTYDGAQNLLSNSEIRYTADGGIWQDTGESTLEYGFDDPFGTKTATKVTYVSDIGEIRLPNYTLVGNGPWTFSVYAKSVSGSLNQLGAMALRISDTIPEGNEPSLNVLSKDWKRYFLSRLLISMVDRPTSCQLVSEVRWKKYCLLVLKWNRMQIFLKLLALLEGLSGHMELPSNQIKSRTFQVTSWVKLLMAH